MPRDTLLFLTQMLRKPGQIVALAPSSRALAQLMAEQVPDRPGPVVELGAGTGKITAALCAAGIREQDLHLFDLNPEFIDHLRARFPAAQVHHDGAQAMGAHGISNARAVVSGLPLLSMPLEIQRAILSATFEATGPDGVFVQFTYGPVPPVAESLRQSMNLTWTRSRRVWGNLPPARVYTFRQQSA